MALSRGGAIDARCGSKAIIKLGIAMKVDTDRLARSRTGDGCAFGALRTRYDARFYPFICSLLYDTSPARDLSGFPSSRSRLPIKRKELRFICE